MITIGSSLSFIAFALFVSASPSPSPGWEWKNNHWRYIPHHHHRGHSKSVEIAPVSRTESRCQSFHALRDDLQQNVFKNECAGDVPDALRLAFHDAIGWSRSKNIGGGADGSLVTFAKEELSYGENVDLDDIVETLTPFVSKYNVSAGDVVQFAAMVGTSNCPGAPRFKFLAGRPPAKKAAKDGFVPGTTDSVSKILKRMDDAGFDADDLVAMLASHSIGRADSVDPQLNGAPFDTTPNQLDGQFYLEVMLKGTGYPGSKNGGEVPSPLPNKGELRLQSDYAIARDSRTSCQWQDYATDQKKLTKDFGDVMFKISMVGQDSRAMFDCSDAIGNPNSNPVPPTVYPYGKSKKDLEKTCRLPMPKLSTAASDSNIPSDN